MAVTTRLCVPAGPTPLVAVTVQVTEPPTVAVPLMVAVLPLT